MDPKDLNEDVCPYFSGERTHRNVLPFHRASPTWEGGHTSPQVSSQMTLVSGCPR